MLPISLDVRVVSIALIGGGGGLIARLGRLQEAGAKLITVFTDDQTEISDQQGIVQLSRAMPMHADLEALKVAFIVGIEDPRKTEIAALCQDAGLLTNVEDHMELCDFHSVSVVRRGDLSIAISTNGKSPALSRRMREFLEDSVGPEWAERMDVVAARRAELKALGRTSAEISQALNAMMDELGWFNQ